MDTAKGIVKLITYQLKGKNVSKSTPGAIRKESVNYYILYQGRDGEQRRENSGTANLQIAINLRNRRVVKTQDGETPVADLKSLKYEDIRVAYIRAKPTQESYAGLKHLDDFFAGMKVYDKRKVADQIQDFIDSRRADDAADPTIRRNLTCLRAMFWTAVEKHMLGNNDVPNFPMPKDSDAAGEYIEPAQFAEIVKYLPENLRPFFTFMYGTACRLGALRRITWGMVTGKDRDVIKLPAEIVKTKKPLLLVLDGELLSPIAALLQKMFRADDSKIVFDDTNYRPEWAKAVAKAGLGTWDSKTCKRTGVRIHDCRCSAAINLLDAGVDEGTVLKIGGWKTRAMLDRYNVQNEKRIRTAMKRGGAYVAEQQAAATVETGRHSSRTLSDQGDQYR